MTKGISVVNDNRAQLADLMAALIRQMARVIQDDNAQLTRRFPAILRQPAPVMMDPSVLRDFVESDLFRETVESYIAGRLEANLLVKVVDMLGQIAPMEFPRCDCSCQENHSCTCGKGGMAAACGSVAAGQVCGI